MSLMISVQNHPQPLNGNKVNFKFALSLLLTGFIFISFSCDLIAQTPLQDAWKSFNRKDYNQSVSILNSLGNQKPSVEHLLLFIKSYNHLNQFSDAVSVFENLKNPVAEGALLQEYYYEAGVAYWGNYQYNLALRTWLTAFDLNPQTAGEIARNLKLVVLNKLTMADLYAELGVYQIADNLVLQELMTEKAKGINQTETLFSWFAKRNIPAQRISVLRQLQFADESKIVKKIRIGLLLPLDEKSRNPGDRAIIGREILRGFLLKLKSEYSDLESRVTLVVKDTRGDPFISASLAQSLVTNDRVDLVFGPVFSDECEQVKPIAEAGKIPFFSPTATDESLYKNSSWFFGLNQTLETRGNKSAEVALKLIGKKPVLQVLLVAEENSDASTMADAFGAKLKGIKGLDLKKGYYKEGTSDIRRSIPAFRDQNEKEDPDAPTVIDLIYAPASGIDQVEMVVSQLSYMKLFGTYIGNTDWDVKRLLKNYRTQLNGMLIVRDSNVDTTRLEVKSFFQSFHRKFKKNPDELALRGADGFLVIKSLLKNNLLNQADSDNLIKKMPTVNGLQSDIWFEGKSSNQSLGYFRVIENEIAPYIQ